jgi:thiamine biosynthesis lipoprotein
VIIDRFGAMGTQIEVHGESAAGLDRVQDWFAAAEAACSRFLPDSELSSINRAGGRARPTPLLTDALGAAVRARRLTGGLVDAGVGARVAAWGYDRTFSEVEALARVPEHGGPGRWDLRDGVLTLGPGTQIDLGGIAKGWAADRAVESGDAVVVSAGGDLRSADPRTVIDVLDASGRVAATVPVGIGALATSSTSRRLWEVGGRKVSHLIDPRRGDPVESPVVSATVTAATAADAEAGAKAVLLLGEEGLAWADRQDWIRRALVEWHDGAVYGTREAA